ncbi:kelch repeat-containing protein [Thalassotalea sp. LPB0316]|uniref:Kelch repeat-containing protein n=1 Tax=Thalassotalea sp. LPB0316 TaxID=2769490 RepID=UPI0018689B45|nr:kelch repeat-containing protein [Thalassotalea sp. LPB0316]QOL25390.1 kelch repeat-containing protein [Thalassotalea sp. LPB0316]
MFNRCKLFLSSIILACLLSACQSTQQVSDETLVQSTELQLQTPRYGHAAINDGQRIFVFGGANQDGFVTDVEIIDPVAKTSYVVKDKLIPRRYFSAVFDGQQSVYIIGGVSAQGGKFRFEKTVEIFDTVSHQVSYATELKAPTRINTAVYYQDEIFVFGGAYPTKNGLNVSKLALAYNTYTQQWRRLADMPSAKTTRAIVHDQAIYVVGGFDRTSSMNVFERFLPQDNAWQKLPAMPFEASAHSLSLVGDKLYVFGDYTNLSQTYVYDFTNEQWQQVNIGYQASRHNSATTIDGVTYVIGGNTGTSGPFLNSIQAFDLN